MLVTNPKRPPAEAGPDNMELNLSWWQDELLRDVESDILVVTAGLGSGKSFVAALWVLDRLALNKGVDAIFIEPTYPLIKRVAIPSFRSAFDALGWREDIHYKIYTSNDNPRIELITNQTIFFMSGESPESIIGITTAAIGVIDEAGYVSQEVQDKLSSRLRAKGAVKVQMLLTGTPEGLGWFADEYDSDTLPGWMDFTNNRDRIRFKELELPSGKKVKQRHRRFRATTFANEHNLDESYIPNLFARWGFNEYYIDSYIYGYFRPFATGLAYSKFKFAYHKVDNLRPSERHPIALTWDFNIEPTWVALQHKNDIDDWGIKVPYWAALANSNEGHDDLEDAVIEFAVKFPRHTYARTPIILYGDPTGHHKSHKTKLDDFRTIKKTLHKLGFKNVRIAAPKSAPLERVSVDAVNRYFSEHKLRICEQCDKVLKSAIRTTWKDNEKGKLDKPKNDVWTHPMDAVKYFICAVDTQSNGLAATGRI